MWKIVCGLLVVGACSGPQYPGQVPPPSVKWTSREAGVRLAPRHEHLALPFVLDEAGTNGTAVVLGYLKSAELRGARYVSDLSIAIQLRHNGEPIECVSQIVPEDGMPQVVVVQRPPAAAATDEPEYETTIRPFQPGQVNAWVHDRDLVCAPEGKVVADPAKPYGRAALAEDGPSSGDGMPVAPPVESSHVEYEERCRLHERRRSVDRYDHYVAARYVPPDLAQIARKHSEWKLVERPPMCFPITIAPGAALQPRIEAEVYYAAGRAQR